MLKLFLWLRYLRKRRVVLLSIAAVALSTALLIVVASLFNGFINAFEQSAVDGMGDVVLSPGKNFAGYGELEKRLEDIRQVEAATATLSAQGLLHLGKGNVRAAEIWGIEPAKFGKVTAFDKSLLKTKQVMSAGSGDITGYVGIGVLAEPNEKTDEYDVNGAERMIGQQFVITTGSTSLTTSSSTIEGKNKEPIDSTQGRQKFRRKTIQFTMADAVFTGIYYFDSRLVYLPIEQLSRAIFPDSQEPVAGRIQIKLHKGADAALAIAQIRGVWKIFASEKLGWEDYDIQATMIETSRQMQSRYIAEIRKQMGVLLLIFGVVSLSAVLLIFCIFYMIVETRRKDIAIMKSCGADSGSIAMIFVGFGAFVGILGTLLGTAAGYVVTKNINEVEGWIRVAFGLKLWKASVYMFSRIPAEVYWQAVWWIVLSAILGAMIGAIIPALSAAITRPVKVLRYE
ncbi:MAG: FtsX-like permease family protein [Sedimentisphaerales bacterium]|jgi:ABC-type lipoprotein release transport system permease subunit